MKMIEFRKLLLATIIFSGSVFMTIQYQNCSPLPTDLSALNRQLADKDIERKMQALESETH